MFAMSFLVAGLLAMSGVWESADAALVTQVEFTSGAANWGGKEGRMLDRLLNQDGTLKMGQYQSWSDIVDPISKGHKTYSLFTSGFLGAPAPSATIDGMSITMDLSSLFLGWKRGDEIHMWNIGGTAKGLFNPDTSEFQLSWDHLFNGERHDHMRDHLGTFFLEGKVVGGAPAAVPLAASGLIFGTGLVVLGSWSWLKRRGQALATA
jgi:hypothetical protein